MIRLTALRLLLAVVLLAGLEARGESRAACDLRGPLSDFWPKVIRDWERRTPGNNFGATQTAAWVSLVYGDLSASPTNGKIEHFLRRWSTSQQWNWVRASIWKRNLARLPSGPLEGRLGFQQNMILLGTPVSNPLLSRALERVGIRLEADSLAIGGRTYVGGDLLLIAILPSPYREGKYILCFAGLSEDALLGVERVPFGETDYVLFRGRKILESGTFEKPYCESWKAAMHPTVVPEHRGWLSEERGTLRYHFDPGRTSRESVNDLARREDKAVTEASTILRFPIGNRRIEIYLYSSPDEKLRETGNSSPVHLEDGAFTIHRVFNPGSPPEPYQIVLLLILKNLGDHGSPGLRLPLALAASADFEGTPLDEFGVHFAHEGRLPSLREIAEGEDPSPGAGILRALGTASFLRHLLTEGRVEEVKQLYLNSSTGSLSSRFREVLGESLDSAEQRWQASLIGARRPPEPVGESAQRGGTERGDVSSNAVALLEAARSLFLERKDAEARSRLEGLLAVAPDLAEAHLLLARIAFRNGDIDRAIQEARITLNLADGNRDILSWAHVTLGRAEAVKGHLTGAAMELQDPSLAQGTDAPRLVADLWLQNLGLSANRAAVEEQLRTEARADLQNFNWDSAEEKLKSILATNPESAEAHFALSEVYMSHHNTWAERATLSNELHPGTTPVDPELYKYLADRAAREMEQGMILSLPDLSQARIRRFNGEDGGRSPLADLDLFDPSLRKQGDAADERRLHFFLGRGYFFASQLERAQQELRLSLGLEGTEQRIVAWDLIYLGFIEFMEGKQESARAYFLAAKKLKIGGRVGAAVRKGLSVSGNAAP